MALTDQVIRAATAAAKPIKLFDGDGLFLLVSPSGSKLWRFKYRLGGVEKLISLGAYPEVSLKKARLDLAAARALVAAGSDPSAARKAAESVSSHTFESVARQYLAQESRRLDTATLRSHEHRLGLMLPKLGSKHVSEIGTHELLAVLRTHAEQGLGDTVVRAKQLASRIFRFARVDLGVPGVHVIGEDLRRSIPAKETVHRAAITDPRQVGELLRALDKYRGQASTFFALKLLPLVFLRSRELRNADWSEIDFAASLWRVPGKRMKMKDDHLVPLARQAVEALTELKRITGGTGKLFPSYVPGKVISENTLNHALRRLGYDQTQQTAHGFRTIASTLLHEQGEDHAVIELQLAHRERNKVSAAYNRAQRLEERTAMMQRWADHLEDRKSVV